MQDLIARYKKAVNRPEDNRTRQILFEMILKQKIWLQRIDDDIKKVDKEDNTFDNDLKQLDKALSLPWRI
jgi:hypothetical protein